LVEKVFNAVRDDDTLVPSALSAVCMATMLLSEVGLGCILASAMAELMEARLLMRPAMSMERCWASAAVYSASTPDTLTGGCSSLFCR
jgi:hypothetical protein